MIKTASLKFFDVVFHARGDPHNKHEVMKPRTSEKEILLLAKMHGKDAVRIERFCEEVETDLGMHYVELAKRYAKVTDAMYGVLLVESTFQVNLADFSSEIGGERSVTDGVVLQMERAIAAATTTKKPNGKKDDDADPDPAGSGEPAASAPATEKVTIPRGRGASARP